MTERRIPLVRPHPIDAWRDEQLHSLFDGRAKYNIDEIERRRGSAEPAKTRTCVTLASPAANNG